MFLDGADGALDRALRVPGAGTDFIFIFRQAEDFDGAQAEGIDFFNQAQGVVHGKVIAAGHARDFFFDLRAGDDENRINQVAETNVVFPDHGADRCGKAQAAGAQGIQFHSFNLQSLMHSARPFVVYVLAVIIFFRPAS